MEAEDRDVEHAWADAAADIDWSRHGVPAWFRSDCKYNIWLPKSAKDYDVDGPVYRARAKQIDTCP